MGQAETGRARVLAQIALLGRGDTHRVEYGDAWSRLGEIRVPTLVLVGDLDLLEIQEMNELLARRIRGARFVKLHGEAHLPHLEGDESCLREIAAFLADIDG